MQKHLFIVDAVIGASFKEKFLVRAISAEEAIYKVELLNKDQREVFDVPLYHAESQLSAVPVEWELDVIPL